MILIRTASVGLFDFLLTADWIVFSRIRVPFVALSICGLDRNVFLERPSPLQVLYSRLQPTIFCSLSESVQLLGFKPDSSRERQSENRWTSFGSKKRMNSFRRDRKRLEDENIMHQDRLLSMKMDAICVSLVPARKQTILKHIA